VGRGPDRDEAAEDDRRDGAFVERDRAESGGHENAESRPARDQYGAGGNCEGDVR
jgi:hypothetical protein